MRHVCGLDVHKDSVFVCILNEKGVVFQEKFGVLTPELERMVGVIMEHGVTEVGMESTSVYWMPVWRVIDPYVEQKLVNPYFIRQLPGKKSDVKDAEWIATCILKGLVRGSYVPEERIQRLRQYDRRIFDLNDDIVHKLTRLDAALQRCNIRLSNYVSTTDCKSYGDVVDAIACGETSPDALLRCVQDKGMLLLALQPPPDGGQEKEQDEGPGRHRQEDAVRDLVHSARRGRLPRLRGGCQRRLTAATAYTALCKVIIFVVARPRFANWLMLCAAQDARLRQQARRGNFNICLTLRSNTAVRAACPNAGDSPNARTKIVGGLAIFRGNIRTKYRLAKRRHVQNTIQKVLSKTVQNTFRSLHEVEKLLSLRFRKHQ